MREYELRIDDVCGLLCDFIDFMRVNMRLAPETVHETLIIVKRFLRA